MPIFLCTHTYVLACIPASIGMATLVLVEALIHAESNACFEKGSRPDHARFEKKSRVRGNGMPVLLPQALFCTYVALPLACVQACVYERRCPAATCTVTFWGCFDAGANRKCKLVPHAAPDIARHAVLPWSFTGRILLLDGGRYLCPAFHCQRKI